MAYLIVGAVAIAATLGGAYAAMTARMAKLSAPSSQASPALDMVKIEPVSVPVVRRGKVAGYVIARVTITAAAGDVKDQRTLLSSYATEAVFRAVYEEQVFDFSELKVVEIMTLADRIARLANERLGRSIVHAAIIDGLSFVEPSGVRTQKLR